MICGYGRTELVAEVAEQMRGAELICGTELVSGVPRSCGVAIKTCRQGRAGVKT